MKRWLLAAVLLAIPGVAAADVLQEGKLLLTKHHYKEAIPLLSQAITTDATGDALFCLAMAYELSGHAAHATATYRKVVDAKGVRASEAARSLEALESAAREAAALDNARIEFEKIGIDRSRRVQEAKQRAEASTEAVIRRKMDAQKVQQAHDAASTDVAAAEKANASADTRLASWKSAGLHSPAGRGRGLRALGTFVIAAGGIGLGATAWYMRAMLYGNYKIEHATNRWRADDDYYVTWGEVSNTRLLFVAPLTAVVTAAGLMSFRKGEAAVDDLVTARDVTMEVEGRP